ncbi:hypothetical protein GE061_000158 [Apolygus lucorum]|uniref:Potassium channel domain-containing protein n=1 Tax=Apolygus lucorum TaxID=248454 RepID=A0A8S9Y3T9_APOLU|nr:hypothetical protein GE061_000158 [Apolygus lucorum]
MGLVSHTTLSMSLRLLVIPFEANSDALLLITGGEWTADADWTPEMDLDDESGGSRGPNRCTRVLYVIWKIFTCLFTHIALVTMVVSYCLLGAATFESLESGHEKLVKQNITIMRSAVVDDIWKWSQDMSVLRQENWTEKAIARIKIFENDLVMAMKKAGWDGTEETEVQQWTFAGALFYSIIVITTIGYGHIAPKTHLGKVTTIFYAVVGIPLMLLCLSNIGSILAHSFRFLYWKVCCYACTQKSRRSSTRRRHVRSRSQGVHDLGPVDSDFVDDESMYYSDSERGPSSRSMSRTRNSYPMRGVQSREERRSRNQPMTRTLSISRPRSVGRAASLGRSMPPSRAPSAGRASTGNRAQSAIRDTEPVHPSSVIFNQYAMENEGLGHGQDGVLTTRSSPDRSEMSRRYQDFERRKPMRSSSSDYEYAKSQQQVKPVPIWLCVFLVVSYIVGGAFLFSGWEQWKYSDSAYFCFITLTTIGFGDFVPAQRVNKNNAEMSIALCSLYLLFGIALLAMSFNLVQEEVISNVKAVARHLGILKDNDRNDSDDD